MNFLLNIISIIVICGLIYVLFKAGLIQKAKNHVVDLAAKAIAKIVLFLIVITIFGLIAGLFIK